MSTCDERSEQYDRKVGPLSKQVPDLTTGREYEVIAVNARAKRTVVVCPGPFTHAEAVTVVSKFNPHRDVRIMIREIV